MERKTLSVPHGLSVCDPCGGADRGGPCAATGNAGAPLASAEKAPEPLCRGQGPPLETTPIGSRLHWWVWEVPELRWPSGRLHLVTLVSVTVVPGLQGNKLHLWFWGAVSNPGM